MAWSDLTEISKCQNVEIVAICDVDSNRTQKARKEFPNARFYRDWRELLDKEAKNIDSVNVSTPDHMHAPIAVSAMQLGKHVYGQKPLAHDIYEVRRMMELAERHRVVTQMGIQIHSSVYNRIAVRLLQDGTIGKIKEVHCWCEKKWGDAAPIPNKTDPVPSNFDWDLWLGVCAERPFIGGYYHPGSWRKRLDFGTGTLGDMGCHILDSVFEGADLGSVLSVRSEGPAPNQWNWAVGGKVAYLFAGTSRTASSTLPVTWYDGDFRPPAEVLALLETEPFPKASGCLFIGTEGVLLLPHQSRAMLFPMAKFKDFKLPKEQPVKHWEQFVNASRGEGRTTAHFGYAGPLTEAVLLGCIASRFPRTTLQWNSQAMKFDLAEAGRFVRRDYRKGWSVPELA